MQSHIINSLSYSKNLKPNYQKSQSKSKSKEKKIKFGPQIIKQKQIQISKKVKKMIHYDCENTGMDDDIPDEDEIYIKENLLTNIKEKQKKEQIQFTE